LFVVVVVRVVVVVVLDDVLVHLLSNEAARSLLTDFIVSSGGVAIRVFAVREATRRAREDHISNLSYICITNCLEVV
jgi:hypothetical protein